MEALDISVTKDYQIPNALPNVEFKIRPGAKNNAFLHNFFSLCLWAHISSGFLWITQSDLRNDVKISVLHATKDLFHKTHPKLFNLLMSSKGNKLKPNVIC